ncbi:hypothetical protein [Janibacter sp. GXQ6167]|uniref:hypothetical protein n=1 Tax=Janibacter sp. GXQ6167 TaxID=3240791 RepID=UPI003524A994
MPQLSPELLAFGLLALGLVPSAIVVLRRWPRLGLIGYILVIAFIPIWVVVPLIVQWPLIAAVGIVVIGGILATRRTALWATPIDFLMVALVLVSIAPFAVGAQTIPPVFAALATWLGAYLVGRLGTPIVGYGWICDVIAVVFTIVAALAIIEFVTGWHGLSSWGPSNSARVVWGTIQERGGLARVEGAFGHSIALGSALAMTAVLTLTSRFAASVRIPMIAVQVIAVGLTFSRTALICAVLGLVIAVVSLEGLSRRIRGVLVVALVGAAAIALPLLQDVFERADEAAGSAAYRGRLLDLLPEIALFGTSGAVQYAPDGTVYFGTFQSIDSQLVLFGVAYGWMTLGLVLLLLLLAVGGTIAGRGSSASIAVVAQIPALMTVALITQYEYLFWFVVGVAAADFARRTSPPGVGATMPAQTLTGARPREGASR